MLGFAIDPDHINYNDFDILRDILEKSDNFKEFQENTLSLSARWIMFFIAEDERKVFSDPGTTRQIYYSTKDELIIGSDPNIINYFLGHPKNDDACYLEYINSKFYKINEVEWYSDKTYYKDIKKLLPNHYYDLSTRQSKRFWIDVKYLGYEKTIDRVTDLLVGSFRALDKRDYNKFLALTAGFDSRVIYAASSYANIDCKYFLSTMNQLKTSHPDFAIAQKILDDDNKDLIILDNLDNLSDDFIYYYKKNVSQSQILPKTLTAQELLKNPNFPANTMLITGNASAVFKDYYKKSSAKTGKEIAKLTGIPKKYPIFDQEFDRWIIENKKLIKESQINMMDLFYWEHRLSNFGIKYVANQDIAVDEFAAFNNREIFLLLMKAKHENKIDHTKIFTDIINKLDPKLMTYPINPAESKKKALANTVKNKISKRNWEYLKLLLKN